MSAGEKKYHVLRRRWVRLIRRTNAGWIVADGKRRFRASELFLWGCER